MRVVSTWPGTSNFTTMIAVASGEINTFLDETGDICDISDLTTLTSMNNLQLDMMGATNTYLEAKLNYKEMVGNIAPQNRSQFPEPTLYDDTNALMIASREKLMKHKRDKKRRAMIYNIESGQYTNYYR